MASAFDPDYGNKVLARVEELVLSYLGPEDGRETMIAFGLINQDLVESEQIDLQEIFDSYQGAHLNHTDAAISLIDGTTTAAKEFVHISGGNEAFQEVIVLFERVLDSHMATSPGRVLPRNGTFAVAAESTGLSRFFKG